MTDAATSSFVYATYIRTTPDRLWDALTTAAFTRQYWFGIEIETDWVAGSPWRMISPDGRLLTSGQVVEANRPRQIVLSWRHEVRPELTAEGHARCVIELEPIDDLVKLTITHMMDRAESELVEAASVSWPKIVSNLKSLLEIDEVVLA